MAGKSTETHLLEQMAILMEQNINFMNSMKALQGEVSELKAKTSGGSINNGGYKKEDEIKLGDLPEFDGNLDPEVYLDWERRIDRIFSHKGIDDYKCFTYAVLKLSKLASLWYDNCQIKRERERKERINSWNLLKQKLRKRFVPRSYKLDLFHKFNTLQQSSLSVEDYIKEFERLSMACDCKDEEEQKILKFLVGLNVEIGNRVELQSFFTFDEACELAVKVERQLKASKLKSFRPNYAPKNETLKSFEKSEILEKNRIVGDSSKFDVQGKNPRVGKDEIKCFKCQGRGHYKSECPNRRIMTAMQYEVLEEEDAKLSLLMKEQREEEEKEFDIEEEFEEQLMCDAAPDHNTLILRKILHAQSSPLTDSEQRENLFRTRCLVKGRSCSVIVDNGSCTNACSKKMADTLMLETRNHTSPYKLNWLTNVGGVNVSKQALVSFEIGEFEDEVWCDVVLMDACALLLGRPWQFDRDVIYLARKNVVSVLHKGKRIGLRPLPPKFESIQQDGSKVISLSTYDKGGSNKRNKKDKQQERMLQLVRKTPFEIGDYVWLSLNAQKFYDNQKGKHESYDERPFQIVHRENYDTFQVLLGDGVCASLRADDLVPCYDTT